LNFLDENCTSISFRIQFQVSTSTGVKSHYFNLHVMVPSAFILGSDEYHTQAGNAISLVCIIENVSYQAHGPCHLKIVYKDRNLTAVVRKLTAEVRYLSSKNRLSCPFKGHFFAVQKMFPSHLRQKARRRGAQKNSKMLLSGQLLKERPFKKKHKCLFKTKKAEHR
jgi:hypothetical protein